MAITERAEGWEAHLNLEFTPGSVKTLLSDSSHYGPLLVQRPFYPEGEVCHVYLLHPPGGVVGGDLLNLTLQVRAGAHALITTPAANKFYGSGGVLASLQQELSVANNAILEWLPQETIVFDHVHANMQTRVKLDSDARFIGWEITCLGRPASHLPFREGCCHQAFEIWREDKPLYLDRLRLETGSKLFQAPWGLAGLPVVGTLIAVPAGNTELETARHALDDCASEISGVSLLDDILVCRCLALQGEHVRQDFSQVWSAIRNDLVGKAPCSPRIWRT